MPFVGTVDITDYITATIVFIVLVILFKLIQVVVVGHLEVLSKKTETDVDDVVIEAITGIRAWVYTLVALFVALQLFVLPEKIFLFISGIVYFAVVYQGIEIALKFVEYGAQRFLEKDEDGDGVIDPNAANASALVTLIARIVLWAFGIIFVLSNMGIEVTSLIA